MSNRSDTYNAMILRKCLGKIQHRYETCAQYALDEYLKSPNKKSTHKVMEVYKCKVCGFFHIGRAKTMK